MDDAHPFDAAYRDSRWVRQADPHASPGPAAGNLRTSRGLGHFQVTPPTDPGAFHVLPQQATSNPDLANLLLEQFGGPRGEDDPGRKDMRFDISTEELSDLELIGAIVGMLNKGAKGRLAEGVEEEGELCSTITGAGNDSHLTQVLYGGGRR